MRWLAELPSTNFRIFVSVCLAVVFVLTMLLGIVLGREIPLDIATMLATFLAAMMGIDLVQFKVKRDTFTPAPPAAPDVEDVRAQKVDADPKED
jgi:hypothetical protein